MKKNAFIVALVLCALGCASNAPVLMKQGYVLHVVEGGKTFFSFEAPSGQWTMNASVAETKSRGYVNIKGVPPGSALGFQLNFSIDPIVNPRALKQFVPLLKTQDFQSFLEDDVAEWTHAILAEQGKSNPGGKLITIKGLTCANTWIRTRVAPQLNHGEGVGVMTSYIRCPMVIDGEMKQFSISIRSSLLRDYNVMTSEYHGAPSSEESTPAVNPDELLKTLGGQVVAMFDSLTFYGKISQRYEDVTTPKLVSGVSRYLLAPPKVRLSLGADYKDKTFASEDDLAKQFASSLEKQFSQLNILAVSGADAAATVEIDMDYERNQPLGKRILPPQSKYTIRIKRDGKLLAIYGVPMGKTAYGTVDDVDWLARKIAKEVYDISN